MNYRFIIIPILATSFFSCSGSKTSASIPVDTGHVSSTETKPKQEPVENKRLFANGDTCKHCDYIYRTQDQQGNVIESEMVHGYKNGEEREYRDGKLVRTSHFVEGGKNGMEYSFSNGKVVDSVYTETTSGGKWSFAELQKAIPEPIFNHLLNLLFSEASDVFAFTTRNGKIATIYKKDNSIITGEIPIVATIDYENPDDFSNFKLTVKKPIYEEMTYKDSEIVYRKIIVDNQTIFEFKKGEFAKHYYDNGTIKIFVKGDIAYHAEEDSTNKHTGSTYLIQEFFENGSLKSESVYEDGRQKKYKTWNDQNILTFSADLPATASWYYDNGKLQMERQGEMTDSLTLINGTSIIFHPNGAKNIEDKYENGKLIHRSQWKEDGTLQSECVPLKYGKIYDENGKLAQEMDGDIRINDDNTTVFSNGTFRILRPNGSIEMKTTYSNNTIMAQQTWDSTGFLEFDYQRNKHIKWIKNTIPETRTEYLGNITYDNEEIAITGNTTKRGYRGEKLVYEYLNEEYIPTLKAYKKSTAYMYDSTGHKILEKVTRFGTTSLQKNWSKQTPLSQDYFLSVDYDAQKHLKLYSGPKKIQMLFKGTSEWIGQLPTYINGTATTYNENGKKSDEVVWKNGRIVSEKKWTEDGFLHIDFNEDKYLKFFSVKTKKITLNFKGKSKIENGKFYLVDGIAQFFDESGRPTKTETYKNAVTVNVQEFHP